ncbi:MAG: glycosyltransferase family 4 protein [Acidimicrobiales bacterium]
MTPAVHQFIPSLAPRDAIGAHALALQELLREMGFRSELFADEVRPEMAGCALPYRRYQGAGRPPAGRRQERAPAWLLYHSSIGSPVADFLARREEPKLVYFHNITPRSLVEAWDPAVGQAAATGWSQLLRLAPQAAAGFANSRYSEAALAAAGVSPTAVVPLLVDVGALDREVDEACLRGLEATRRGAELLFVGRISPHKAQHRLIQVLAAYRRAYDPAARLHLVGGPASASYSEALGRYVAELGLDGAVDLAGSVSDGALAAHYRNADAFVCASSHEGFCVPLLEAMHHGLPIVAYGAAAVPETVGGAGLVVGSRAPTVLAAAVHRALTDGGLRRAMAGVAAGRLAELGPARTRAAMAAAIEGVVGRP